jgi:predicted phage-related endonuclease
VCLIGGQHLVWCDVMRDSSAIDALINAGSVLWSHVESGTAPPADGSAGARKIILSMYPTETPEKEVALPADLIEWDQRLQAMKVALKEVEGRKREAENKLRIALGDAQTGILPNGVTYTLKTQTRAEHVVKESSFRVMRRKAPKGL